MATLTVRGLDDDLVRKLRVRAAEHGRSAEAEHREILRQVLVSGAPPDRAEIARRLAAFREATGDRTTGAVADLLTESRRDRMNRLAGPDDGM